MSASARLEAAAATSSPQAPPHWARRAVIGAVLGLALSPVLTMPGPAVALIAAMLAASLKTQAAPLAWCVGLYGLTLGYESGIQPEEAVFLLYYGVFAAWWVVSRTFIYRTPVLTSLPDLTLAAFLAYLPVSLGIGMLNGASLSEGFGDALNLSMLFLYFPAKELSRRYDWGAMAILGLLLLLGLAAINQNIVLIQEAFRDAETAKEIARGRVAMSEMLIAAGCLISMAYAITSKRSGVALGLLVAFGVFVMGLAVTQSRAYYVDLVLGLGILPFLVGPTERRRFVLSSVGTFAVIGTAAWLVLGETFELIMLGVVDRFLSIGTATQTDLSYLNRLLENEAAWERVWLSPILGNGVGVPFRFYDAIFKGTWVKTFVHNGYIMLWFKFGLLGLAAVLTTWLSVAGRAIASAWAARGSGQAQTVAALAAGVTLVALLPSHMVSATFATSDTVTCVGLLMGVAAGASLRSARLDDTA